MQWWDEALVIGLGSTMYYHRPTVWSYRTLTEKVQEEVLFVHDVISHSTCPTAHVT